LFIIKVEEIIIDNIYWENKEIKTESLI
jgi:hypothetical protein